MKKRLRVQSQSKIKKTQKLKKIKQMKIRMEEATMKKSIKVILAMVLAWLVMLPAQGIAAQIVQDNSAYGIQVMPRPVNEDAEKEDLQTILERQKDRDEGDAFYLKTG